jgi:putative ABC transport system substrate-binding protein
METSPTSLTPALLNLRSTQRQHLKRHRDGLRHTLVRQRAGGLLVARDPFLNASFDQLATLALRHAVPTILSIREFATAGGLVSYGPSFAEGFRQIGVYTGRILKGEKPADLPVVLSTKFELAINLKTAKMLGLTVSNSMQLLADEVID